MLVRFFAQCLLLDFELHNAALDFVNFGGQGIDFHAKAGGGFVNQVDCFVRKKTIGDVTLGKHGRGEDGRIFDAHTVMDFVALFQAAQDGDGVLNRRFADIYRLEAAFQRGIFLNVLAIFVQRGRADRAQLASRQRGLEHVGSVHGTFRGSGADQGVQLVDKKNYLAFGFRDFFEHGLQAVFEFAAIFSACNQCRKVQRDDALRLQNFGDITGYNSLGQAFDDGGFTYPGFSDQDWVIFRASRQNLHHAANFFVATDYRIQLAPAGQVSEVAAILFQRAISRFGILRSDAMAAPDSGHGL